MNWPLPVKICCIVLTGTTAFAGTQSLTLTEKGFTDYVIVSDQDRSEKLDLAAKELAEHLKKATGATFQSVGITDGRRLDKRIVVGSNALADEIVGHSQVSSLGDEEWIIAVKGDDLVIAGGSDRGTLYGVYSFLEKDIGCRWFTWDSGATVPKRDTLTISIDDRRETFAFSYRTGGFNKLSDPQSSGQWALRNGMTDHREFPQIGPRCHTLFFYIPPHGFSKHWAHWNNPPKSNFFETHPEFFSMDRSGQRVDNRQLCFSNPELRTTLTRQIDAVIKQSDHRHKGFIALEANDVPGKFCHCPECRKLEQKYDNVGGPLYDYLLDLCAFLKEHHPGVFVKTIAYRKDQTEVPPKNLELPDNVIVNFAPIDDDFSKPLDHPNNRDTLKNLTGWCRLADNVWVWYYTNYFITGGPPFSSIGRNVRDMELMHDAGVEGFTFQQTTATTDKIRGFNCADLQAWLLLKLCQDPDQDAETLITEFMTFCYGKAAKAMTEYITQLNSLRDAMTIHLPWNPSFGNFGYLTPERIAAWQNAFDRMETLVADVPDHLRRVRRERVMVDIAALEKWKDIEKAKLLTNTAPKQIYERIQTNVSAELKHRCLKHLVKRAWASLPQRLDRLLLKAEVDPKPLPEFFSKFPADRIKQSLQLGGIEDDDAACGRAIAGSYDRTPVQCGLYDEVAKKTIVTTTLTGDQIKPDRYCMYKLGRTTLSPRCRIWVSGSWVLTMPLDEFYVEGYPFIEWDIYMSLKFEGPKYGSKEPTEGNRILCDLVVLVQVKD